MMPGLVWNGAGWSLGSKVPVHRTVFTGKADTSAGSVPNLDTGASVSAVSDGAAGAGLRVSSGFLTFAPTAAGAAAGYLTGDAGGPVSLIGARFKIASRSTAGESLCLAMTATKQAAYGTPFTNAGVHFVITRSTWQVDYITGGSSVTITQIAAGALSSPLTADDTTIYEVNVYRQGQTVWAVLPGGQTVEVTSEHIASKSGVGWWAEPFCAAGNTDGIVKIQSLWVDTAAPPVWSPS